MVYHVDTWERLFDTRNNLCKDMGLRKIKAELEQGGGTRRLGWGLRVV